MGKLFSPDNPIINALNDLTDLIILGILWLICSIPIITIGASCTALCYAYNKHFKYKEGHVTKLFFHSFKADFKQSTIVWLIMAVILGFLGADYYFSRVSLEAQPLFSVPLVIAIAIAIFVIMWSQYAFAYIARFENDTKTVIKNTILMMLAHFPWSFLLLLLFAVAALFFPLLLFFIPCLYMVPANLIHERIFSKYMKEEEIDDYADV